MRKRAAVTRAVAAEAALLAIASAVGRRRPAAAAALLAIGAASARGAFSPCSPIFGRVHHRGAGHDNSFALTFDDGPGPSTPAVLDALAAADARATFFVLGRQAERHPEMIERIVGDGHELANHGYDHGILVFRGRRHVADQIRRTEAAVGRIVGPSVMSRRFRAPHGFRGPGTTFATRRAGYEMTGWSLGVFDSDQPGTESIVERAVAGLTPGTVLLLHDADGWAPEAPRDQTAAAIGPICAAARERGLRPVPLRELA